MSLEIGIDGCDRDKIARVSRQGKVVAAQGLVPPTMPGGPWLGAVAPHDLAAARADLARSRYGGAAGLPPATIYSADGSVAANVKAMLGKFCPLA